MNIKAIGTLMCGLAILFVSANTAKADQYYGYNRHELPSAMYGSSNSQPAIYFESEKPGKRPLVIVLHGAGQSGGEVQNSDAANTFEANGWHIDVVHPRSDSWSDASQMHSMIKYMIDNYEIDLNQIYVKGFSMGGGGTWRMGLAPRQGISGAYELAALMPVASYRVVQDEQEQRLLKNQPIWQWFGEFDSSWPDAVKTAAEMQDINLYYTFTTVWGEGHGSGEPLVKPYAADWMQKQALDGPDDSDGDGICNGTERNAGTDENDASDNDTQAERRATIVEACSNVFDGYPRISDLESIGLNGLDELKLNDYEEAIAGSRLNLTNPTKAQLQAFIDGVNNGDSFNKGPLVEKFKVSPATYRGSIRVTDSKIQIIDPDGNNNNLTYSWESFGTGQVTHNGNDLDLSISFDIPGLYTLLLKVTDPDGGIVYAKHLAEITGRHSDDDGINDETENQAGTNSNNTADNNTLTEKLNTVIAACGSTFDGWPTMSDLENCELTNLDYDNLPKYEKAVFEANISNPTKANLQAVIDAVNQDGQEEPENPTVEVYIGEFDEDSGSIINNEGQIALNGSTTHGEDYSVNISADSGYLIDTVFVINKSNDQLTEIPVTNSSSMTYTFEGIINDWEIYASFKAEEVPPVNGDRFELAFNEDMPFTKMLLATTPSGMNGASSVDAALLTSMATTTSIRTINFNYKDANLSVDGFYKVGFDVGLGLENDEQGELRFKVKFIYDDGSTVTEWFDFDNAGMTVQNFSGEFSIPLGVSSIQDIQLSVQQREFPQDSQNIYLTKLNIFEVKQPGSLNEIYSLDFESGSDFNNSYLTTTPESLIGFLSENIGGFDSPETTDKSRTLTYSNNGINLDTLAKKYLRYSFKAGLAEPENGDLRVRVQFVFDDNSKANFWHYFNAGDELNTVEFSNEFEIPENISSIKNIKIQVRQNELNKPAQSVLIDDLIISVAD